MSDDRGKNRLSSKQKVSFLWMMTLGLLFGITQLARPMDVVEAASTPVVNYSAHVQSIGWQAAKKDGATAGTTGQSKQVEAFKVNLTSMPYSGGIEYRAHMSGTGWTGWVENNAQAGFTGQNKAMEGFQIRLTGEMEMHYSVLYRAHVQGTGWQPWKENGVLAGTMGQSLRVEAFEIKLVPKQLIYKSPLTVVPNNNTEIDSKYSFIAKFIHGKTTVVPFGSGWKQTRVYEDTPIVWWSFNPGTSNAGKGKTGVVYKNVGRYGGKDIDLKITINDWERYTDMIGNMSYSFDEISHISQGYSWVDQTWTYLESGTNKEVVLSGYMTIADIDARQGIKFSKETSSSMTQIFVPSAVSRVLYENVGGEYYFYDATNMSFSTWDETTQFTFLHENTSQLRFKWVREFDKTNSFPDSILAVDRAAGEMFTYLADKPAKTEVLTPDKTVILKDQTEVTSSTITNVNEPLKYAVYHQIPSEASKYYYNSYVMTDTLPDVLKDITVKVVNEQGNDETGRFTIATSGTKVTATAKNTKDAGFYDKQYTFLYTANIDKTKLRAKLSNNTATLSNTATVTVDGKNKTTNTVTSKVTQRKITVNHIDDITGATIKTETTNLMDGEGYDYSPKTDLVYQTGYNYRALGGKQSGTVNGADVVLNFRYTRPWTITVNHIDKDTNKVLKTETAKKYNGESYSYAPKTDLVYDSAFKYKPATATQTGTVNGKDVSVNLYYTGPRTITVNHVDKDTGTVLKTTSERKHDGETYSYDPITTFKNAAGDAYKVVSAKQSGTVNGKNITVTMQYTQPRIITVQHIDQETNKVLNTITEKKYDGETYSYGVKTDLVYNASFNYKPVTTVAQTGTIAGKNVTVKFYYLSPRTLTINHVDNDDNKVIKTETDRKHNGDKYSYAPKTDLKTSGGDAYKALSATQSGTVNGNTTITIKYTKPRTITVQHIDQETNKVLNTLTEKKYDAQTYSYGVKTDLVYNASFNYKPITTTAQTGTVAGKDVTLKFYYLSPRTLTINHIDSDDNKVIKTETDRKHNGEKYSYAPKTDLKTTGGDAYKALSATQTGTVDGNMTITIKYTKPRTITVNHVDDDDSKVITTVTEKKYDGETYDYVPKTDLKTSDNFAYKPLTARQTGKVSGNAVITMRYIKPRVITINHLDNDTNAVIKTETDRLYVGDTYTYNPRTDLKTSGGDAYKSVTAKQTGKITGHHTVTFNYTKPRLLTIRHIDADTNKVIKTDTQKKYDGEGYTFTARTDLLFENLYTYYALAPATLTGTVSGNKTYDFTYTKPSLAIGAQRIRIKTESAAEGLPLELTFNLIKLSDSWANNQVTLNIIDKVDNKVVFTKKYAINDIKDGTKLTIPSNHLTYKGKRQYEAVLETLDAKKLVTIKDQNKINTDGYIASGQALSMDSTNKEQELSYVGVAMTERVMNESIKLYNETIKTTVKPTIGAISGYGLDVQQVLTYETTVTDDTLPSITATALADKEIADGQYSVKEGRHSVTLTPTNKDVGRKRTTTLDVPTVYIDAASGDIYASNGEGRVNGQKRLYVPVWLEELGRYEFTTKTDKMGRNDVVFTINRFVDVDAYMFGYVGSDTYDKDAILIQPKVIGEDPFEGR